MIIIIIHLKLIIFKERSKLQDKEEEKIIKINHRIDKNCI
jgi:hypothetical protein